MKKTLLVISIVLVLITVAIGVTVYASTDTVYSGTWGELTWELDATTGELLILGEGGMMNFAYVSSTDAWLAYKSDIKNVIIEHGITNISACAFANCINLTNVDIPDSVEWIETQAFQGCESIENIEFHDGLLGIGEYAFLGCSKLKSIDISDSVIRIGGAAFSGCDSITSLIIPNGVKNTSPLSLKCENLEELVIGDGVSCIKSLSSCGKLKSITIGSGVTEIKKQAFFNCNSLTDVYITDVEAWLKMSIGTINYGKDCYPNYYANLHILDEHGNEVNSIVIPDTVSEIREYAFKGCLNLSSITIHSDVTKIGDNAFRGCEKLVEIVNNSSIDIRLGTSENGYVSYYALDVHEGESKVDKVDDYLFYTFEDINYLINYVGKNSELTLPLNYDGQTYEINKYAFYKRDDIISIVCSMGITKIGDYSFFNCFNLANIIISDSITEIGKYSFSYCNIATIKMGASLKAIGECAFYNCNNLKSVELGPCLESIGAQAFYCCHNITSIEFGDKLNSLSRNAFTGCNRLVEVINNSSIELISSVNIPNSVMEIHNGDSKIININGYVFYPYNSEYYLISYTGNETEIVLPSMCNGENYIIWNGFLNTFGSSDNDKIISIVIPEGVKSIQRNSFSGCTKLKIVYLYSYQIAASLNSKTSCGYLIQNAEIILIDISITQIPTYITGETYQTEIVNLNGIEYNSYSLHKHVWENCDVEMIPCVQNGFEGSVCTTCGLKTGVTTLATHNYNEQGHDEVYHWDTCGNCGDKINVVAHEWNSGEITTPATHIEEGVKTYTCTDCGETKTGVVDKLTTHTADNWRNFDVTQHKGDCECGETIFENHEWNDGEITTPATHLADGVKTYTCIDCGTTKTEAVSKTAEHAHGDWTKHDAAQHKKVCECGDVVCADHTWNDGDVTTPATSTAEGVKTYTCTDCGETKTEAIEKLLEGIKEETNAPSKSEAEIKGTSLGGSDVEGGTLTDGVTSNTSGGCGSNIYGAMSIVILASVFVLTFVRKKEN